MERKTRIKKIERKKQKERKYRGEKAEKTANGKCRGRWRRQKRARDRDGKRLGPQRIKMLGS